MNTTAKIKTFQDVLDANGKTLEQFNEETKNMSPDTVGYEKVKAIVLALNGGKNVTEGYYPWFNSARSASGFPFYGYGFDYSSSFVASRHLFKTSELAIYAGKQFLAEYGEYING